MKALAVATVVLVTFLGASAQSEPSDALKSAFYYCYHQHVDAVEPMCDIIIRSVPQSAIYFRPHPPSWLKDDGIPIETKRALIQKVAKDLMG